VRSLPIANAIGSLAEAFDYGPQFQLRHIATKPLTFFLCNPVPTNVTFLHNRHISIPQNPQYSSFSAGFFLGTHEA
jgi:hypothetical protein